MKHLFILILDLLCGCFLLSCMPAHEQSSSQPADLPISEIEHQLQVNPALAYIWISKSTYTLELRVDTLTLARFPMVLGGNPIDDKLRQGDKCTPEGIFSIRDFYPHKKWSKFIWIDYPNEASWTKHKIAKSSGKIPLNASIGGEIGIHGVPKGYDRAIDMRQNWTLGCISLKTKDINWLFEHVHKGMKVEIVP